MYEIFVKYEYDNNTHNQGSIMDKQTKQKSIK